MLEVTIFSPVFDFHVHDKQATSYARAADKRQHRLSVGGKSINLCFDGIEQW